MKKLAIIALLEALSIALIIAAIIIVLTGCTPIERSAYNTIVGAKAFLDQEKLAHPECATATTEVCVDLKKAVASKDLLIDALEVYCSGPQFEAGGACQAPAKGTAAYDTAVSKLQAAIAAYNQVAKDLQAVK